MSMFLKGRCRIRRALAMVVLLAAGMACARAEVAFRIGPKATWSYADLHEYVYINRPYNKLSQLDWDSHNVVQFGVAADLELGRFCLETDFSRVEDADAGYMQDYDWLYLKVSDPDHPVDTLTEFSEHHLRLLEKDRFAINAGLKVVNGKKTALTIGGGFQYLYTYLEGYGGYLQHSSSNQVWNNIGYTNATVHPYDSERPKLQIPESTRVISYQQKIESMWFTLRFDVMPSSWLTFGLQGGISPWQMIDCYDFHYVTNTTGVLYNDKPQPVLMYEGSVSVAVSFFKRSSLIVSGSVQSLPYAEGNNYMNYGDYPTAGILGGTSYLGWDVSLSYLIRIF